MENSWLCLFLQVLGGGGVHHSLTTPYGVEKSIENPLRRTGGAAPPLGRKKQNFELLLTPGYPVRERNYFFSFERKRTDVPTWPGCGGSGGRVSLNYAVFVFPIQLHKLRKLEPQGGLLSA